MWASGQINWQHLWNQSDLFLVFTSHIDYKQQLKYVSHMAPSVQLVSGLFQAFQMLFRVSSTLTSLSSNARILHHNTQYMHPTHTFEWHVSLKQTVQPELRALLK